MDSSWIQLCILAFFVTGGFSILGPTRQFMKQAGEMPPRHDSLRELYQNAIITMIIALIFQTASILGLWKMSHDLSFLATSVGVTMILLSVWFFLLRHAAHKVEPPVGLRRT